MCREPSGRPTHVFDKTKIHERELSVTPRVHNDVGGFQVSMDELALVESVERFANSPCDIHGLGHGESPTLGDHAE